jgi:uncharacterized membrane protein YdjX (TVP38/TMEM64 family)
MTRLALLFAYTAVMPVAVALLGLWFLPELYASLRAAGAFGQPLFAVVATAGLTLALLPANGTAVLAGALFGPAGLVPVVVAYVTACAVIFEVVRRRLRPVVQAAVAASPRARALQAGLSPDGFRVVILARLMPSLSFACVSLALAAGPVNRTTFLLGSAIGMLPRTVVGVGFGVAADRSFEAIQSGRFPTLLDAPLGWPLLVAGLGAMALLAMIVARAVRQARRVAAADGVPSLELGPST